MRASLQVTLVTSACITNTNTPFTTQPVVGCKSFVLQELVRVVLEELDVQGAVLKPLPETLKLLNVADVDERCFEQPGGFAGTVRGQACGRHEPRSNHGQQGPVLDVSNGRPAR